MLNITYGNFGLLGYFGELLLHHFLDSRLRELGANVVGLFIEV